MQGVGTGGPIPNGAFATSGTVTSDIVLNSSGYVASGNAVTVTLLGLQHDFAGDLQINLSYIDSNNNTVQTVNILNRLGSSSSTPYGTAADFGNHHLNGDNYQFNSDYAGNMWSTVACADPPACTTPYADADSIPGVSTDTVNDGQYFPSTVGGAKTNLSYAFSGLSVSGGTWRLTITDAADPNVGSYTGWQISITTVAGVPMASNLTAIAGSPQSASVGRNFATALQALVTNSAGNPVSGVIVTFTAPSSGASATFAGASAVTTVTNSSGVATSPALVSNSIAGTYTVTASATGLSSVSYSLTNTASTTPAPPTVVSLAPNSGSALTQTFTAVYSDPAGASSLSSVYILFNSTVATRNACYVYYDTGGNQLYLLNDGGTAWSSLTPGTSSQVANSQCTLSGTGSSYTTAGNNGTLKVALKFSGAALENIYLLAADSSDNSSGWVQVGSWGGATVPAGLTFVPVSPCRVADTRNANGPFGGPIMAAGTSRTFFIPNGACNIPASAAAYSLNVTVVPTGNLGYLTIWPSGQSQPLVSTLNSDGRAKANAAIVPAGTNGGVSVHVSDDTHVILDINGYFASAGSTPSLAFYPLTPCRIADTRNSTGALGGPFLSGGQARTFSPLASSCGLPATAKAYSLNLTAIPRQPIGFLATWPSGKTQPLVSTLNASTGAVTANAAIVPAGTSGSINVYSSSDTDLVIDVNGYFGAPGAGGLSYYIATPCRAYDSRFPAPGKPLDGTLAISLPSSPCATPSTAQAVVLNATVVPSGPLGYLLVWPDGAARPLASTLNAFDGSVTSNMALVPATNGSVDCF